MVYFTSIISSLTFPTLCIGNFNAILSQIEKYGGELITWNNEEYFAKFVSDYRLFDLGFHGAVFTKTDRQPNVIHVKERLDKAYDTFEWMELFKEALVRHLPVTEVITALSSLSYCSHQRKGRLSSNLNQCGSDEQTTTFSISSLSLRRPLQRKLRRRRRKSAVCNKVHQIRSYFRRRKNFARNWRVSWWRKRHIGIRDRESSDYVRETKTLNSTIGLRNFPKGVC